MDLTIITYMYVGVKNKNYKKKYFINNKILMSLKLVAKFPDSLTCKIQCPSPNRLLAI